MPPNGAQTIASIAANRNDNTTRAARQLAKALGHDADKLMAEAAAKAKAAGMCAGDVCTPEEIARWAKKHGKYFGGALGTMAKALAGEASSSADALGLLAKQLGLKPEAMQQMIADAAKKAGYCKAAKCTPEELAKWAREKGSALPAPLGSAAKLMASEADATDPDAEAARRLAEALGMSSPADLMKQAEAARRWARASAWRMQPW